MRRGGFFVGYGNLKGNIEKRGVLNGYEVGSNRLRMMESNPYFGVRQVAYLMDMVVASRPLPFSQFVSGISAQMHQH